MKQNIQLTCVCQIFPPRVLKKLEQIEGVELVKSNGYLDQANLSGTFKISNFIKDSIEVEKALFSFFSTTQYLIFTNEPDFAQKIERPLVEYFVDILSIEDLYSYFFWENYLVLNYEEDEEDPKLIDGYLHVSSAEMLSLWKGEFKLSCGCCNKFISQ